MEGLEIKEEGQITITSGFSTIKERKRKRVFKVKKGASKINKGIKGKKKRCIKIIKGRKRVNSRASITQKRSFGISE